MTNQVMTTRTEALGLSGIARDAAVRVLKLLDALSTWRRIRRAERYLLEQSDYALADIGVARSDILGALRGEFRG